MLIQTSKLSHEQLTQLDSLCVDCKNIDGNLVAIYRHLLSNDRIRPANILYYEHDTDGLKILVGFLGAFFFSEDACEIGLMVAPGIRRKGIASKMIRAILPLIQIEGAQRLVFSSPHGLNNHWLAICNFRQGGSEFEMHRSGNKPIAIQNTSTCVRIATNSDIPVLTAIDNICFPENKIDTSERIHTLLNSPTHCLFIINHEGHDVGKAHFNVQSQGVRLSDVAILPSAQGRGLGTILLTHCINHAVAESKPNIVLDVETTNKQALRLYTRLGFSIINAHDYWSIDQFGLTGFLPPL